MEIIEKFISTHPLIIFFFVLAEAIIIIFLIGRLLSKWAEESDNTTNLSESDAKHIKETNKWHNECNKLNNENYKLKLEISILKKEKDALLKNHSAQSSFNDNNERINSTSNEWGSSKNSYDHIDYAKDQQKKDIYVKQSVNSDGTVRSDIEFNVPSAEPVPAPVLPPRRYEYLEAANGGQFRKLLPSEEKCFFRTWEENGVRKFEFHGNVENALANINAIFDDVCEIEGKQNGATQIINVDPGILDSKLKVETPAKIKLA